MKIKKINLEEKIVKVDLRDVIEAIEFEGELLTHFYNKKTGVIMYVEDSSTAIYKAEDIEKINDFEDWEQELIRALHDLKVNPEDYIKLPDQNKLDEYKMMVQFCKSLEDIEIKNNLRELKEEIERKGHLSQWYDYREDAERKLAIKWCNDNNIEY